MRAYHIKYSSINSEILREKINDKNFEAEKIDLKELETLAAKHEAYIMEKGKGVNLLHQIDLIASENPTNRMGRKENAENAINKVTRIQFVKQRKSAYIVHEKATKK